MIVQWMIDGSEKRKIFPLTYVKYITFLIYLFHCVCFLNHMKDRVPSVNTLSPIKKMEFFGKTPLNYVVIKTEKMGI